MTVAWARLKKTFIKNVSARNSGRSTSKKKRTRLAGKIHNRADEYTIKIIIFKSSNCDKRLRKEKFSTQYSNLGLGYLNSHKINLIKYKKKTLNLMRYFFKYICFLKSTGEKAHKNYLGKFREILVSYHYFNHWNIDKFYLEN